MKRFIEGADRDQSTLFPERLDDFIAENNPVRVVEAFVEALDLSALGFAGVNPHVTGRPAYHPSVMMKLYIYGYLNRITSSRRLERETQRNVELMWLIQRLSPDFKTIADFRKDNGKAIRGVCREFVMLCRRLDLFTEAIVAIDGSKFKAVNNRDMNFTPAKMKRRLEQIDKSIARYLGQLDSADHEEPSIAEAASERLNEKIASLKEEMQRLKALEAEMNEAPDKQLSLTDPDARSMKTRGNGIVGYNVQTAVDAEHHLIVAHDVINTGSDRHQLATMAKQAHQAMGVEKLTAVADRGYYTSDEILACEQAGITPVLPRPQTSDKRLKGLFGRDRFRYEPDSNTYRCPAGESLIWRYRSVEGGRTLDTYWSSACQRCPIKAQCTEGVQRRIKRWEHEEVLDAMQARLDAHPDSMRVRRQTAEHPFGTLKAWMGATHFLTRTLPRVRTEMSLHVLAYNLKRMLAILGIQPLMATLRA
jgi:transposase